MSPRDLAGELGLPALRRSLPDTLQPASPNGAIAHDLCRRLHRHTSHVNTLWLVKGLLRNVTVSDQPHWTSRCAINIATGNLKQRMCRNPHAQKPMRDEDHTGAQITMVETEPPIKCAPAGV